MLDAFLTSTAPGRARVLFTSAPPAVVSAAEAWAEGREPPLRIVSLTVDRVPEVRRLLTRAVEAMAEVALRLWPAWHDRDTSDDVRAAPSSWLEGARARAVRGELPLPRGHARRTHLRQLALALGAPDLLLLVACGDAEATPARAQGLARGAEWLAREAEAPVVVVAPPCLGDLRAFEAITYRSLTWEPRSRDGKPAPPEEHGGLRVWPIVGQPHPFSPGEQKLAEALGRDPELAPLFACNQRLRTSRGSAYIVDLVWAGGRVVVEVDGYAHHANRHAFVLDRQRDYELVISGYLVLRLPHDEVVEDVELVVDKIRDVVAFRRMEGRGTGGDIDG